jgi:hypothetical protein
MQITNYELRMTSDPRGAIDPRGAGFQPATSPNAGWKPAPRFLQFVIRRSAWRGLPARGFTSFVILLFIVHLSSFIFSTSARAQGNVGIGTTAPDASALLDLTSLSRGFLVPRMTQSQRNAITLPATGLLVLHGLGQFVKPIDLLLLQWNGLGAVPRRRMALARKQRHQPIE